MILHELTTNALKYGALSVPDGVVRLGWRNIDDEVLQLDWQEEGGPTVMLPVHLGFGANMMKSSAKTFGGKADIIFNPNGLHARISVPLTKL
jgi:two-component sensor histidine kinase